MSSLAARSAAQGLYRTLLRRNAAPAETDFWAARLQQGAPTSAVAAGFLTSPEFQTRVVAEGYQTLLGRAPDAEGAAYWQTLLGNGLSDVSFCAGLLSSDEYFAGQGGAAPATLPLSITIFWAARPRPTRRRCGKTPWRKG